MKPLWLCSFLIVSAMGCGAQAYAQTPQCSETSAVEAPWQSWNRAENTVSGNGAIDIDQPYQAELSPMGAVPYLVAPKQAASGEFGGIFHFTVAKSGLYSVAVSDKAWISVVEDGVTVTSAGHGHGANCSGIRKYVNFNLNPGHYRLQIENAQTEKMKVLIVAQ